MKNRSKTPIRIRSAFFDPRMNDIEESRDNRPRIEANAAPGNANDEFTARYLVFLGMQREAPTLDYLNRLIRQHRLLVPFNNIKMLQNDAEHYLRLMDANAALNGIVNGICGNSFTQHVAFCELLRHLGFEAIMPSATTYGYDDDVSHKRYIRRNKGSLSDNVILVKLNAGNNPDNNNETACLVDLCWVTGLQQAFVLDNVVTIPGENPRCLTKKGDLYSLKVSLSGKWKTEYTFKAEHTFAMEYARAIRFSCSNEHHLSHTLLLMRCNQDGSNELIYQDINKKTGVLKLSRVTQQGESETELTRDTATEKLREFGLSAEDCQYVIDRFELASIIKPRRQ